jgi:NitT/TauT family transport system substrate-binding protein
MLTILLSLLHPLKRSAAITASLLVVLLSVIPEPGLSQGEAQSIKVGVIPIDNGFEAYYAQDMGFFKKAGLNVQIVPLTNGGAIAAAVANGALDIGFSNLVSIATAHTKGIPFTVIVPAALNVTNHATAALFVAKDSPYKTAESLNGKTIAVNGLKNISELSTRAWLDEHGGDSSTIKFIEMPDPSMPAAVREKRVDAAMAALSVDPTINTPAAKERVIGDVFDGISTHFLVTGYFTTSDWVRSHQDEARKFVQAIFESARWANKNHDASAVILSHQMGVPVGLVKGLTRSIYAENTDPKLVQPVIDAMARYKIISQPFPAEEIISPVALDR